jgi:ABC transport system ATP-binding/permease protein
LLYRGRRVHIGERGITIGRGEQTDLPLSGERISREHARVEPGEHGQFWVTDLGSRHGTELNGERFQGERRRLASGDTLSIDEELMRFVGGDETRVASRELEVLETQTVRFDGTRMSIGRDPSNDLVLEDPNVSRFHAEIAASNGRVELVDLGSRNGTRLNGSIVERAHVEAGSEIGIGPFALVFDGESFVARDERGSLRLDSKELSIIAGDRQILAPTSISIQPGEFVAVIGESGSGKSTLLKALAGVTRPSGGEVTVNGEPLSSRLTDIGYVPQDEIVHAFLTVTEALTYAARLRLPDDTSQEEVDATVERVLGELDLGEHRDKRIGSLSGGQRKRVGVAAELLSRPSLLFLDEPTSGLDPGLETKMMELLRELSNEARAVAVVTHATKNLRLCDKVAVMGRGGELTYFGAPDDALPFFRADDFDGIYGALDDRPAIEWRREFESSSVAATQVPAVEHDGAQLEAPVRGYSGRAFMPQAGVLTERYLKLLLRDRKNLMLLLAQVPVLAVANAFLFQPGIFDRPGGSPPDAAQLLFLIAIVTIWLGSIDAAREIVKERSVFVRESAVGMRLSAYMVSKVVILFSLVAVQAVAFFAIASIIQPLDASAQTYLEIAVLLVFTGFVAVAMGMLISAAVDSEAQAMSFNPLVLIPQLLFAGAIVPVSQMSQPVEWLSRLVFAQWSFASIGTSADMNGRLAEDPAFAQADRFGTSFFDVGLGAGILILTAFLVVFLAGTTALLRRQAPARR